MAIRVRTALVLNFVNSSVNSLSFSGFRPPPSGWLTLVAFDLPRKEEGEDRTDHNIKIN